MFEPDRQFWQATRHYSAPEVGCWKLSRAVSRRGCSRIGQAGSNRVLALADYPPGTGLAALLDALGDISSLRLIELRRQRPDIMISLAKKIVDAASDSLPEDL